MSLRTERLEAVAEAARLAVEWERAGCPNCERLPMGVLEKRLAELDKSVALAYREWWEEDWRDSPGPPEAPL